FGKLVLDKQTLRYAVEILASTIGSATRQLTELSRQIHGTTLDFISEKHTHFMIALFVLQLVPCPFDPGHRVPTASLERHSKSCRLHALGYSQEDKAQMVDTTFFYEGCKIFVSSIFRNHYSWIKYLSPNLSYPTRPPDLPGDFSSHPVEVPETLDRAMCTLTRADRIAIYDHVIIREVIAVHTAELARIWKGDDEEEVKVKEDEEREGDRYQLSTTSLNHYFAVITEGSSYS
uniref:CHHC U11-48K-type domain-containing protein n=1 Tax=Eptatretus burgeri TaxID=7764 RepID=A0A8C4R8V9_EPTBU